MKIFPPSPVSRLLAGLVLFAALAGTGVAQSPAKSAPRQDEPKAAKGPAGAASKAPAQAPVEDRTLQQDRFPAAQQSAEFARQAAERADARVNDAQAELRLARDAQAAAQKQLDEARARADQANKSLEAAKSAQAEARRNLAREGGELEKARAARGR